MTWETYKEKASKINPRWFFKRSQRGFEVWEKSLLAGNGYSEVYLVQVMPRTTMPLQWICYLRTLQSMDQVRRSNGQAKQLAEFEKQNADIRQRAKDRFNEATEMLANETVAEIRREASRLNVSEHAMRNNMKGVRWDDTKKVLRQMREEKAGLK